MVRCQRNKDLLKIRRWFHNGKVRRINRFYSPFVPFDDQYLGFRLEVLVLVVKIHDGFVMKILEYLEILVKHESPVGNPEVQYSKTSQMHLEVQHSKTQILIKNYA